MHASRFDAIRRPASSTRCATPTFPCAAVGEARKQMDACATTGASRASVPRQSAARRFAGPPRGRARRAARAPGSVRMGARERSPAARCAASTGGDSGRSTRTLAARWRRGRSNRFIAALRIRGMLHVSRAESRHCSHVVFTLDVLFGRLGVVASLATGRGGEWRVSVPSMH